MVEIPAKPYGVIWISGYSAAGKTTVGRHVEHLLRSDGYNTLFLDGDQLRSIFANKWDYSKEGRVELALIYFRLCSHLSKQGLVVIISAVAMFDEVRSWFKDNLENGVEVYLKVPLDERTKRETEAKNIHSQPSFDNAVHTGPEDSDVVCDNHDKVDIESASRMAADHFVSGGNEKHVDFGMTQYWAEFHNKKVMVNVPSPFAGTCLPEFSAKSSLTSNYLGID